ncbi:MAG: DNA-3-methyladenine glycosylase family protein [Gemmataceae bacterium]
MIHQKAQRHLARRDPIMKQLIQAVGPCTLRVNGDHFACLARSIVAQQISARAAASILAKLEKVLEPDGLTPAAILRAADAALRGAGLSAAKLRYVRDLAEKVDAGAVSLATLADLPDEQVIDTLLPIKGIGRWTAQMFLIFSLGRLDVLPVDDFGLRAGVLQQYRLAEMPTKDHLRQLAEPWRPYRSIATWYLWRSLGNVPQSD